MTFNKKNKEITSNKIFGIFFSIFFFIIFLWPLLNENESSYWPIFVSLFFLTSTLFNPKILNPLNKSWFYLGIALGRIVSPIVMGIIFFFIVTPTGIVMRILGKDILNLKKNDESSYWINKKANKSSMKRQF